MPEVQPTARTLTVLGSYYRTREELHGLSGENTTFKWLGSHIEYPEQMSHNCHTHVPGIVLVYLLITIDNQRNNTGDGHE